MITKPNQHIDQATEDAFRYAIASLEFLYSIITYPSEEFDQLAIDEMKREATMRINRELAPTSLKERNHRGPVAHRMFEALLLSDIRLRKAIEHIYRDEIGS